MPAYYHIAFTPLPGVIDPQAVENAIAAMCFDWLRYAGNCYVVWTNSDASMLAGALMTVSGMKQSHFLVVSIDLIGGDGFAFMPPWAMEWLKKDRSSNPLLPLYLSGILPPPR